MIVEINIKKKFHSSSIYINTEYFFMHLHFTKERKKGKKKLKQNSKKKTKIKKENI